VKKGTPGYRTTKIENKIGLRMVQNADILLKDVYVPDEDRLTGINSFQDTNKVTSNDDGILSGSQLTAQKSSPIFTKCWNHFVS
jgi:hypothetical protein